MSRNSEGMRSMREIHESAVQVIAGRSAKLLNTRGQSILEYLVVITIVVLALTAIRTPLRTAMNNLFDAATDQANEAADRLRDL
jgi:hypothetical protein